MFILLILIDYQSAIRFHRVIHLSEGQMIHFSSRLLNDGPYLHVDEYGVFIHSSIHPYIHSFALSSRQMFFSIRGQAVLSSIAGLLCKM